MMRGEARQGLLGHPSRGCLVIRTGVAATTSNSGVFKPARLRDSSWAASTAGATWYRRRSDDKHWSIEQPLPACPRATRSRTSERSRSPPNSECSCEEHPDTSSSLWGDRRGGVAVRTARDWCDGPHSSTCLLGFRWPPRRWSGRWKADVVKGGGIVVAIAAV